MRKVIKGATIFDGSGEALYRADVTISDDRIQSIDRSAATVAQSDDHVIDAAGMTLMPGMTEAHAHLDFGASVGRIPANTFALSPVDRMLGAVYAARVLLDHGYTSAYSAGTFADNRADILLQAEIEAGRLPGPRLRSSCGQWMPAFIDPENKLPFGIIDRSHRESNPAAVRDAVKALADTGIQNIKIGLNGESSLIHGTARSLMFYENELEALMEVARDCELDTSAHLYSDQALRMALRHGIRLLYHCAFASPETIELMAERRDEIFVAPGPGILLTTIEGSGLSS
ncbi:amidohydrolase family protein [Novosphingobium pentaromativorans]|uniref:Amidohydrolase-related domain-containing protein n=1 Tax=Novosphingobium pentaromativorans US6-1 TaxID=1088721 RepID=G6EFL5_9SPHN|nr:amidohydrolase family protein [Novosphingobium pentaromativorans]EHJ59886.1 hypothetical protein NSU_3136 [Novosphingobium pentaromativorans US6-1]